MISLKPTATKTATPKEDISDAFLHRCVTPRGTAFSSKTPSKFNRTRVEQDLGNKARRHCSTDPQPHCQEANNFATANEAGERAEEDRGREALHRTQITQSLPDVAASETVEVIQDPGCKAQHCATDPRPLSQDALSLALADKTKEAEELRAEVDKAKNEANTLNKDLLQVWKLLEKQRDEKTDLHF